MTSAGFETGPVQPNSSGSPLLGFTIELPKGATEAQQSEAQNAFDSCWQENVGTTAEIYEKSLAVTGAERDAMMIQFTACIEDAGFSGIDAAMSEQQIVGAIVRQSETPPPEQVDGFICMDRFPGLWVTPEE